MLGLVRPLACLPPARDSPTIPRRSPVKLLTAAERGGVTPRSSRSSLETRISLVLALTSQAFSQFQRLSIDLMTETSKYALPRRFEARNLEEALMAVPDLETISYQVVKLTDQYVIREVEPYLIAETTMPGSNGFSYDAASRSFNVLAAYLFGKNTSNDQMKMTTPVYTRKIRTDGMRMDMTTPVITKQSGEKWKMAFVMPSKYGANLPLPIDPSVEINEVPGKTVAVSTFSGFVTDQDVKFRESNLLDALRNDSEFQVKHGTMVEVAQFNPPFTLPFARRNEISLEVERKA